MTARCAARWAAVPVLLSLPWVARFAAGPPAGGAVAAGAEPVVTRTRSGVPMVVVPAGWFDMGSVRGRAGEAPVHRVWVDAFYIDQYEVTQQRYGELVRGNPSHFKGPDNPMEQMSWAAAALYCNARSRAEGLEPCYREDRVECKFSANGYRLPTEAEWEYACRAGAETEYCFGDDAARLGDHAWYADNSAETTHAVGGKEPNRWGLYDMHGNVAEWCNDSYGSRYYQDSPERDPHGPEGDEAFVLRGGAWNSPTEECRSAYRRGEDPGFGVPCFHGDHIGFRCVRRAP